MSGFKDNFSKHSEIYQRYRPTYPEELFEYLSTLTKSHDLAWDCGTGNGQAALSLTRHYRKIYATDPSQEQINNAIPHDQILYKVEKAEHSGLESASVDLITTAQALHWFDFDKFYTEVNRVLKKDGVIAVWTYSRPSVNEKVDAIIYHLHDVILDDYWLYENRLVDMAYGPIPFPFKKLKDPGFKMHKALSYDDVVGLLHSWSAVQRFIETTGENPVSKLEPGLSEAWGEPSQKKMTSWKITLLVGKPIY